MQIHELNEKSLTNPAWVAFDDGTDTYKTEFNECVENAAESAVAATDLTQNAVAFTSGDASSPTAWTNVSLLTSGSTLAVLFNRISTMIKNVRYLWSLIGSNSFANVAATLSGAIGNNALNTTAKTLSGAINEHESDISTLNSNMSYTYAGTGDQSTQVGFPSTAREIYVVMEDTTENIMCSLYAIRQTISQRNVYRSGYYSNTTYVAMAAQINFDYNKVIFWAYFVNGVDTRAKIHFSVWYR